MPSRTLSARKRHGGCTSATTRPGFRQRLLGQRAWPDSHPGHDDAYVNYKNPERAPLLFISGSDDNLMPPKIQRSNAKHYKAEGTITEVKEYESRWHLASPSQEGWEEIADYALTWATEHALAWATSRSVPSTT